MKPLDKKLNDNRELIIELYKAHFTAKEIAEIIDVAYAKVSACVRGLKLAQIQKYNRYMLSPILAKLIDNTEA